MLERKGLVERVPTPRDDPGTRADESTRHFRAGDIMVWSPARAARSGHHMVIVGLANRREHGLVNEAVRRARAGRRRSPSGRRSSCSAAPTTQSPPSTG